MSRCQYMMSWRQLSSGPSGTTAVCCSLGQTKAERSRHVQPLPERRGGRKVLSGALTAWSASTLQQTRDDDVQVRWRSAVEVTIRQNAQPKLDPVRNSQPVLFTEDWVICSAFLAENIRRAAAFKTVTFAAVWLEDQPAQSCSSPAYWEPVHVPVSTRHQRTTPEHFSLDRVQL